MAKVRRRSTSRGNMSADDFSIGKDIDFLHRIWDGQRGGVLQGCPTTLDANPFFYQEEDGSSKKGGREEVQVSFLLAERAR